MRANDCRKLDHQALEAIWLRAVERGRGGRAGGTVFFVEEAGVTVSRHRALVILIARRW
jgi:hypothetical protein